MSLITKSLRVKRTPFTDGVEKAGVKAYTVYNHTLLATEFDNLINDYHHLKQHVQIWDVSLRLSMPQYVSCMRLYDSCSPALLSAVAYIPRIQVYNRIFQNLSAAS